MIPEVVVVSKMLWDQLTPEEKLIFKTAAMASAEYEKYLWAQWEEKALKAVQEGGAQIFYPDITLFQKAVQPLYDQYPQYKELIEKIQAVK